MTTRAWWKEPKNLLQFLGAFLGFIALLTWGLSSPVGATPDEDYHLASMWCGQGERDSLCDPGTAADNREIPLGLTRATCYAFKADQSAACQEDELAANDETTVSPRGNFVGDYPPVFFYVASFFVGDSISTSVMAFRAVNAAIFVLMIAATAALSTAGLRRAVVLGAVTTAVPLSMFLVPSINPSSWALLSALTLAVAVLGYLTVDDRRRRIGLGALAGISLLLGAGARADAAMYAVIAIGGAGLIALSRTRDWRRYVYPAVLAVVAVAAYLSSGQSSAAEGGSRTVSSLGDLVSILLDVPSLWVGALGGWGLGWLDTPMPALVWVAALGAYAGVVFTALGRVGRMQVLVLAGVGAALVAVPTYIQYLSGSPVGAFVQPRYVLPLMMMLVVLALSRLDGEAFRLSRAQWALMVAGLSVANAVALHQNIRRYVTGLDVSYLDLDFKREWWWGSGAVPGPMAVWVLGSIAFAAAVALVTYGCTRPAQAGALLGPSTETHRSTAGDDEPVTPGASAAETGTAEAPAADAPAVRDRARRDVRG